MSTDTNRTPADIAVARGFGGPVTREEIQRAETERCPECGAPNPFGTHCQAKKR